MRKFTKLEGWWEHGPKWVWGTRYVASELMTAFEHTMVPLRDEDGVHIYYTDEELEERGTKGQETHKYVMGIKLVTSEFPGMNPQHFLKAIDAELTIPDDDTEQEAAA